MPYDPTLKIAIESGPSTIGARKAGYWPCRRGNHFFRVWADVCILAPPGRYTRRTLPSIASSEPSIRKQIQARLDAWDWGEREFIGGRGDLPAVIVCERPSFDHSALFTQEEMHAHWREYMRRYPGTPPLPSMNA